MYRLKVVQHNILSWVSRKFDLSNTYRQLDADIILINSHGLRDDNKLKIPGYRIYQQNVTNELNDGVAIAVKCSIRHKVEDDFISETLAIETYTNDGPLLIATSYLPPRRPYLPHPDFLRLFRRQTPVIMAGDLNARHPALGSTTTNQVGRDLLDYLRTSFSDILWTTQYYLPRHCLDEQLYVPKLSLVPWTSHDKRPHSHHP